MGKETNTVIKSFMSELQAYYSTCSIIQKWQFIKT